MSTPNQTTFQQFIAEQLVQASDLMGDNDATRNLAGEAIFTILGVQNALPATSPLGVAGSGTSLQALSGGTGYSVFVQGRVVDTIPLTILAIPSNAGQTRVDLVAIQYAQTPINPHSIQVQTAGGPVAETGYQLEETVTIQYVQGTSGVLTPPAPPAGFAAFYSVTVPNGVTLGTQCTFTPIFQTIRQILSAVVGAGVTSLNGLSGAVTAIGTSGITVSVVGGQLQIAGAASGVQALNGLAGALTLAAGNGILISVTGSTITISYNPPTSFVGMVVAANAFSSTAITGGGTLTATLPAALGAGTWLVEAWAHGFDWSSTGSATLQGAGTGFTNESGVSNSSNSRTLMVVGQCASGVTPSATLTVNNSASILPNTSGVNVLIKATRVL